VRLVGRCYAITPSCPLRTLVDALSLPGIDRLVITEEGSNRIEGIVSLRDLASYIFI